MRKLAFITFIGLSIWACSDSGSSEAKEEKATTSISKNEEIAKKVDGEKIYKTRCVVCHGINGDMGISGAKDLTESEMPLDERINIITNGKNVMTPFGQILEEDEIKAVAEYSQTLKVD